MIRTGHHTERAWNGLSRYQTLEPPAIRNPKRKVTLRRKECSADYRGSLSPAMSSIRLQRRTCSQRLHAPQNVEMQAQALNLSFSHVKNSEGNREASRILQCNTNHWRPKTVSHLLVQAFSCQGTRMKSSKRVALVLHLHMDCREKVSRKTSALLSLLCRCLLQNQQIR